MHVSAHAGRIRRAAMERESAGMKTVYLYGMRSRGFSPGCQPKEGWIDTEVDPLDEYWNVLVYARPLSDQELKDYELDFIGKRLRP